MAPVCPPNYVCTFTPHHPQKHFVGPWYEGTAGIVVSIISIIAITIIVICGIYYAYKAGAERREQRVRDRERQFELAREEQRTMQLDAAKGDPEMLKMVREMQQQQVL